jgi:hypothetical protein
MAFRRVAFGRSVFDARLGGNMGAKDGSKLGLLGEDTVFSVRVRDATGGLITYNPEVRVFHKVRSYRLTPRYVRRRAFWEGYTKAFLRREVLRIPVNLSPERRLLSRILLKFLPKTLKGLCREPSISARRLIFAIDTLFYVALGYASGRFPSLGRLVCPQFER